ncbi:CD209 antigen-like protein C [Mytilus galloprovincialis]
MTVTTGERYAGDTRLLSCSAGYSIIGNVSITCLASGAWSPISAICAPNDISEAYLRSFRDSTYIFVHTRKNYDEAKETCISMCGQLLEINDKEEDTFIDSTIPEVVPAVDITDNYFPWIGLEIKVGGTHEWQSGNTTNSNNFANWFKSEPNYLILGSCSYLTNLGHGYQWFDGPKSICTTEKRQFICESR